MGDMVSSKQRIRTDVRYVRQMLREIEAALKANDYATIIDRANEASCAAAAVLEAAAEISGLDTP